MKMTKAKISAKRAPAKKASAKKASAKKASAKKASAKKAPASATRPETSAAAPSRKVSGEREYVLVKARNRLEFAPHFVVEEVGETLQSRYQGKLVMTFHLDGNEAVNRFQKPKDLTELTSVLHHYVPLTNPPGWLEFRRPATRDPGPGLQARLGDMTGTVGRS